MTIETLADLAWVRDTQKPDRPMGDIGRLAIAIAAQAEAADAAGRFPAEAMENLARAGWALAAFPRDLGGGDLAREGREDALLDVLRLIGAADLSIGRLFEGHVNAVLLVERYGSHDQLATFAAAVRKGAWSGVWNAEERGTGLRIEREGELWRLQGRKILCSGAGTLTHPLVVAACPPHGPLMVLPRMQPGDRADLSGWTPLGMRSTATGTVDLSGMELRHSQVLGEPGDYFRDPLFKTGAWRFCAVQLGGIERLLDLFRDHLRATDRGGDLFQLQRLAQGGALALSASAALRHVVARISQPGVRSDDAVAQVGLVRGVVERAAMEVIDIVQRGAGLRAMMRPNPMERVIRDLSTYLRQPAPDAASTDAAKHLLARAGSAHSLWSTSPSLDLGRNA